MIKNMASIIILTYNNFDNLKENIKSIYSQTYDNIEIIISDDGSKNFNKLKIEELLIKNLEKKISYKIIHHKKNIGTVKNFNNAIKESKGEFIIPLSQDDTFYNNNSLENIIFSFSAENKIVTGIRIAVNKIEDNVTEELPEPSQRRWISKPEFYKYLIYNGNILSGASTYYKREVFDQYGYFDEDFKLLEDFPFFLKILRNKQEIKFIEVKTIKYGTQGISSAKIKNKMLQEDYKKLFFKEAELNRGFLKKYLLFCYKQREYDKKKDILILYITNLDIIFFKIVKGLFSLDILF